MKDVYRYAIENDLVRVFRNGTVYKYYKSKNRFQQAAVTTAGRDGKYQVITVMVDGKQRHLYVHRLVATAYIPNPEGKPEVNHIDGDSTNNHARNLEWATSSENTQHAYDLGLIDPMRNAEECQYCYSLTRAEDNICTECKYLFSSEESRQATLKEIRRDLELIDIRALTQREQEIVYLRYLGYTYKEIGDVYNFSRQRAEQIISDAKLKVFKPKAYPNLERHLEAEGLDEKHIAALLDLSELTVKNRLEGKIDWKLSEAITIKEHLGVEDNLETLFSMAI